MSKVKKLVARLLGLWYVKYVVVAVLGVLFVCFLDDNSLWAHLRNRDRIDELSGEIERYEKAYHSDQTQIHDLRCNPKAVEKIAREQYFMKADDEDIFVLSEATETATEKTEDDETAQ